MSERISALIPMYVAIMPRDLNPGIIYICHRYGSVIHLCACGCGIKTVTPIKPEWKDGWTLTEEDGGKVVTLEPSIGNMQFPCGSHYYVRHNKIVWC